MHDLTSGISAVNAERVSAAGIRAKKRGALIRGVPGLPKAEDYLIPWMPPPAEETVARNVAANPTRRGLIADPGGHELQRPQYIKPKMLNSWEAAKASQPARSYKRYIGENKGDLRELQRSHSQPCEFTVSDVMGKQHKTWLKGHFVEREKHMHPIFFYRKGIEEDHAREEEMLMKKRDCQGLIAELLNQPTQEPKRGSAHLHRSMTKVNVLTSEKDEVDSLQHVAKARSAPKLDHDIEVDPPRFDYVPRISRLMALSHPWQLAEEKRKSRKR
eukprot:GEMP01049446.1.p1 GENE.GEMP01049446.1~~GEMP01049446.1.p1  ORF type:complete len:273 (+),score=68.93 GEMP01049446.1:30-848(+)